jgi:two-component system sensor histidine kinase KdpD
VRCCDAQSRTGRDAPVCTSGDVDAQPLRATDLPHNEGVSDPEAPAGFLGAGRVLTGWALATLGSAALTAVLLAAPRGSTVSFEAMLYLSLAVVCALVGGRWPAVTSSALGVAALNYWFTPPLHTLEIADARDLVTLGVFLLTSLAVAGVVDSAARRRERAVRAEAEAATLGMLNRTVLGGRYDVPGLLALVGETFDAAPAELVEDAAAVASGDTVVPAGHDAQLVLRGHTLTPSKRRVLAAFASHLGVLREREELARQTSAARELEAGNRTRTALLAAVSHDLRTPLAGIRSAAETLRRHGDRLTPADREELLAAVESGTARLTTMVSDLLDMSRLQTGAVRPALVECPLREIVAGAAADLAGADRVQVGALPAASVDPGLCERVVANLLANALHHSVEVEVEGVVVGRRVRLSVIDHGPGVAAEDRALMFAPFQRLGDDAADDGVGLGLAVARGLTEAQGGVLTVEDTPGGGLTMVLDLAGADA